MKKQFAVLGLSRFGESVAINLQEQGSDVVVVEQSEERVERIADMVSSAIIADASSLEVMQSIGIENFDGVVVTMTNSLEASIMATMNAKELGVKYVMAVAKNESHEKLLRKIGADYIMYPEKEMGERIARSLLSDNLEDWFALSDEFSILELAVPESWIGKSLMEINVRKKYEVNVIGVKNGDEVRVVLDVNKPFEREDIIIIIGANDKLEKIQ